MVASALILHLLDRWERERVPRIPPPEKQKATVLLVGYADEEFPGKSESGSYLQVGCNDFLVPTEIPVSSKRLQSVLYALTTYEPDVLLHNAVQQKSLRFIRIEDRLHLGVYKTIVHMEGDPVFGGICDVPRLKAQLEETLKLYLDPFEIHLNGSAKRWECLGNESGTCAFVQE